MLYDDEEEKQQAEAQAEVLEANEVEEIEDGKSLEVLKGTRGYQLLEDYIKQQVKHIQMHMLTEIDFKIIRRLQETARAYNSILSFVDSKIDNAKVLLNKRDPQG